MKSIVIAAGLATTLATSAAAFDVNLSFGTTLLEPTQITRARIDFVNNATNSVTDLSFVDDLNLENFIATPANVSNSCGGVFSTSNTASNGSTSLSGGTIPARVGSTPGTCFIEFDLYAASAGTYVNQIAASIISGDQDGVTVTNPQEAEATFAATVQRISGSMALAIGGNVLQGGESTDRIITLTNPNDVTLSEITFTHDLSSDSGYNLQASGPVTGTCGGTATVTATTSPDAAFSDTSVIDVSNASIPGNASCTIIYSVTPSRDIMLPANDTQLNHAISESQITSREGASNTAFSQPIRTLTGVEVDKLFDGSKSAELNTNTASGTDLGITITNYNGVPVTGFDLTDPMPAGLEATNIFRNTCGGTVSTNGQTEVTVTGGSIGAVSAAPLSGVQTTICNIDARIEPTSTSNATYINTIPGGELSGFQYAQTSAAVEVTDVIAPENPLTVALAFQRSNIFPGEYQRLTYTFTNTYDEVITNIDLINDLVADLTANADLRIGNAGIVSNSCGASVGAVPNATTVTIENFDLQIGASCAVAIEIQQASNAPDARQITNTIPTSNITFDLVDASGRTVLNAPSDSLQVDRPIDLTKQYAPETVPEGGETRLTLTFTRRSRVGSTTSDIAFVDNLPTNHIVAPIPNIVNGCGGTVTATPGADVISLSGGLLGAVPSSSLSCDLTVSVVAPSSPGSANNTVQAGDTTATDNGQPAGLNALVTTRNRSDRLTRTETDLTMTKEFLTQTIKSAEKSRVRITIANTASDALDLTGVALTDDFGGTVLQLADDVAPTFGDTSGTPNANGCRGGVFSFVPGAGGQIMMTDAFIDDGATCYIEFNTTSFVGGNVTNRIFAGDLITDQGTTNPIDIAATLTVEREINLSKGFSPEVIATGETAVLTISIVNDTDTSVVGSTDAMNPTLVDTMPAGVVLTAGTQSTTCGGASVSINGAGDELTLSNGSFPANSSCTVTADVTVSASGTFNNTIPVAAMVTDTGPTNARAASGTLRAVAAPSISKSFSPASIDAGEVSTVIFTLTNPNDSTLLPAGLTGATFGDTLTDMEIAAPPGVGGTCGVFDFSASSGGSNFTASGIALLPASSCTITLDVTSSIAGTLPNTATGVATDQTPTPGAPSNTANLTVSGSSPVTLSKRFAETKVTPGATATLIIELTNPNAFNVSLNSPAFTDTFPTSPGAMTVAAAPNIFTTCGGALIDQSGGTVDGGDTAIRQDGGSVPANSSCYISVDVQMAASGTYVNTTTDLESSTGTGPMDSATIEVTNTLLIESASEANRDVRVSDNDFFVNSLLGPGDTVEGQQAFVGAGSSGNVDLTIVSTSAPVITADPDTGVIKIAGGTGAGTYSITYEICQAGNAGNCASQRTETVVVSSATIAAASTYSSGAPLVVQQADFAQEPGNVIGTGDALDGAPATVAPGTGGNVDLTISGITGPDPAAISVNVNTGVVAVGSGAAAGTYVITYQICEDDVAANCASATETVEVRITPITAASEALRNRTGSDDPIDAGNLIGAGDRLDGTQVTVGAGPDGTVDLQVTAISLDGVPSALAAVNLDTGNLVIAPGAPDGDYVISYDICEEANRSNCASASETVRVTSNLVAAAAEATRNFTGRDGAINAGSVLSAANDQIDELAATVGTGGSAILSVVSGGDTDAELSLNVATGALVVAAGTPEGTYTLRYRLCEAANTDNCAEAVEIVEITDTSIVTAVESARDVRQRNADQSTMGVIGSGDQIGGAQAVPGFGGNVILRLVTADPGLSLDPETGLITVGGDTAVGAPTITYRICEPANQDNCATATETVNITRTPLTAASEATRMLTGADATQSAGSVIGSGDQLDGAQAAVGSNVTLSVVMDTDTDIELSLDTDTGILSAAAGTSAGTYTLKYSMCEALNSNNCALAIETVQITDTPIVTASEATRTVAQNDNTVVAGNVLAAGDQINGVGAVAGTNVTLSLVSNDAPLSLNVSDGTISVAPNTAAATYTLRYRICEPTNSDNCAEASEFVEVVISNIQAVQETARSMVGDDDAQLAGNVIGASDQLSGAQAVPGAGGNIVLSVVAGVDTSPELTLDLDTGDMTLAAGAPVGGYTLRYRICEATNLSNCAEAVETVNVSNTSITAGSEPARPLTGADGAQTAGNVLSAANDTLDGAPAVPDGGGNVVLNTVVGPFTSPGLTMNVATGVLNVAAGQAAGTYTLRYNMCEAANTDNCLQATETVVITNTSIAAAAEPDRPLFAATDPQSAGNVLTSMGDLLDGNPAVPGAGGSVSLTVVAGASTDAALALDTDSGDLTLVGGTPPGRYTLEYQICEVGNADNCGTAIETAVVSLRPLVATADPNRLVTVRDAAQDVGNALSDAGDLLENAPVAPGSGGDVILSDLGSGAPELSLNTETGVMTLAPYTPPGTYLLNYQICEAAYLANCVDATETVFVALNAIAAMGIDHGQFDIAAGGATPSVLADDSLGGDRVTSGAGGSVLINVVGSLPDSGITLDIDSGVITIAIGTPPGDYAITYQICEVANVDNCATATETLTVVAIEAVPEDFATLDTNGGSPGNVLMNDSVGGSPATSADVIMQVISADDGLSLDVNTGVLTLAPDLPAGAYTLTYEICAADFPTSCEQATETVVQGALPGILVTDVATVIENGDGITGVGDTIQYTIRVENTGNTPMSSVGLVPMLIDGDGNPLTFASGPTFQGSTGGSPQGMLEMGEVSTYVATFLLDVATVTTGEVKAGFTITAMPDFNPDVPGTPEQIEEQSNDGILGDIRGGFDGNVLALAPVIVTSGLSVDVTSSNSAPERGDPLTFSIEIENETAATIGPVDVRVILPPGFLYRPDTASLNGSPLAPAVNGRVVTLPGLRVPPFTVLQLTTGARLSPGLNAGEYTTTVRVIDPETGAILAIPATVTVRVAPQPVFDCSDVFGKVFDDRNRNGRQDAGEDGISAARMVAVDGTIITADAFGRFSVPCAALPRLSGQNFILKLDERSLPTGFALTTENPRVVRLSAGRAIQLNFGATLTRQVNVDLNAAAFDRDGQIGARLNTGISRLLVHLGDSPAQVNLTYHLRSGADGASRQQAWQRLRRVERHLRAQWDDADAGRLTVRNMIQQEG